MADRTRKTTSNRASNRATNKATKKATKATSAGPGKGAAVSPGAAETNPVESSGPRDLERLFDEAGPRRLDRRTNAHDHAACGRRASRVAGALRTVRSRGDRHGGFGTGRVCRSRFHRVAYAFEGRKPEIARCPNLH